MESCPEKRLKAVGGEGLKQFLAGSVILVPSKNNGIRFLGAKLKSWVPAVQRHGGAITQVGGANAWEGAGWACLLKHQLLHLLQPFHKWHQLE